MLAPTKLLLGCWYRHHKSGVNTQMLNVGVGVVVGVGVGVGVGAIKAGSTPCCWYRHHKSGVGALLGGGVSEGKTQIA